MARSNKYLSLLAVASVSAMLLTGCGSGDPVSDVVGKLNSNNVIRVASCYAMFQQQNNYKGPKNIKELKACMNKPDNASKLEMMGIDASDIDSIFISERDDEEILIRWKVKGTPRGCYEPVAFEQTGSDGSRRVGFANGTFEEVEEEKTYQDMLTGKFKPGDARQESAVPKFDKNGNKLNKPFRFERF